MSFFFFQAEDGIRDVAVTGVQTCALPICTAGSAPNQIVVADVNSDGLEDITVANAASDDVRVLLGRRDGTLGPGMDVYPVGAAPSSIIAEDVTGDGLRDLVVANLGSNDVSILPGSRAGGFETGFLLKTGRSP